jgi:predicted lipase
MSIPIDLLTASIRFAAGSPAQLTEMCVTALGGNKMADSGPTDGNLYDIAAPQLNLSILIYFYTELRSSTKILLEKFAKEKKMTHTPNTETPSDVNVLYNAIDSVDTYLAKLEESTDSAAAVKDYKLSLEGLENLKRQLNLTSGDVQIFETYFKILSNKTKYATDIKRDLCLYSKYINPLFVVEFGGSEFNLQTIEDLVDKDESSYVHYMDDDFTKTSTNVKNFINGFNSEIIYAIAISDKLKTISVVFRGSVNASDWVTNAQVNSTECKFPGFTTVRGIETVKRESVGRVHEGFYKYLFEETQAGSNGSTKSKGEEIMGQLASLLNGDKKGYTVYVTGHSLGGALSTLMAARCAALDEIDTTIINVSFASPFVGDQKFRDSFYKWERSNRIKHLRVSNFEDVVPLIPFSTLPGRDFHTYKHTGINVKLFNKSLLHRHTNHLSYPKKGSLINEVRNSLHSNIFIGINAQIWNHLGPEYHKRLTNAKEDLEKMNLWELYGDSKRTGWKYYKPLEGESKEIIEEVPDLVPVPPESEKIEIDIRPEETNTKIPIDEIVKVVAPIVKTPPVTPPPETTVEA